MQQPQKNIAEPFSSYQLLVIALLALLQFTIVLDFMVLAPLGDFLMKSLSISPKGFGLVVSSYAFSAGASGIMAAGFADKFDRKKLLLFFYSGFIIGTLCCALATNYEMLLGARIVTGLFGGVIGAISMTIITDIFAVHQRGRVMGVVQMGFAASQVLGIPIGLYFANIWGWHSSFLMIVILAIMIAIAILIKIKPIDKHLAIQSDKSAFLHLWHAVSNRSYQTGFIATAFMGVGGFMLMPFGSAYLINNINITEAQLPLVFMFTGLAAVVVMPLIGKLSDKVDKFMVFTGGSLLAVVMILVYTNLSPVPLWQVIVINMVLFMGVMSRMIPATTLTMSIPDLNDRGAFMSVNASIQQMAGGIAALCAGLIVTQRTKSSPLEHYDTLGIVVSALILLCIFLVYRVSVMVKKKDAVLKIPAKH
ncbi:MFS transporter [Pedobacter heparinus]|uniref:Major facilitator superfamily MFS_1 n=1 Tax=Pedobacter heparinus (strain ATCC 13125 / DSM 2366 / CIP 104194 / JCM 7457 / NBRC 12017 / NCIMB 9290 / NRRL B-14731 / HIM 762-3) TaxID=485917 RepID=C6XST3_PEDHD|nr:MFS transporter [Pedobacter heparinus]ACU05646.1 major facilitator superfamily MFS_1 [Pedobacter heparinus DSM 2366]